MPASCGSLEVFTLVKCSGLVSILQAEAGRPPEFNTTLGNIGRILLHPLPPQKGAHHGHCQPQIQWADERFHVLTINFLIPFLLYPWTILKNIPDITLFCTEIFYSLYWKIRPLPNVITNADLPVLKVKENLFTSKFHIINTFI